MLPQSLILLLLCLPVFTAGGSDIPRGVHLPLYKRKVSRRLFRRGPLPAAQTSGAVGLGDYEDTTYSVLVTIGTVQLPLVLDTGSADIWAISSGCVNCTTNNNVPVYPLSSFKASNLQVQLLYGDSSAETYASGPIGQDIVSVGGLELDSQYLAAINSTNTNITLTETAGIFGLGFPINSIIWNDLFVSQYPQDGPLPTTPESTTVIFSALSASSTPSTSTLKRSFFPRSIFDLAPRRDDSTRRPIFPGSSSILTVISNNLATVNDLLGTFSTNGPLVSRLVDMGRLASPSITITLQRDTVEVGGNVGLLSLGELPAGIDNETLTWVPIRGYTVAEGGIPGPSDSPNETYPISWEVPIDDVYLDGQLLKPSTLSPNISVTALIDTGNSLIRGPADVISQIMEITTGTNKSTGTYDCSVPHTLEFQIGGQKFPVDPRDFFWQVSTNSTSKCSPNIAATDPPKTGYLYSWSLGDPFLKGVLASFYYGNLTYPSNDPPRMGFLSTVPSNADTLLQEAIAAASKNGGNFPALIEYAPNSTYLATSTGIGGVPQAPSVIASPSSISDASSLTGLTSTSSTPTINPLSTNKNGVGRSKDSGNIGWSVGLSSVVLGLVTLLQ